MVWIASFISYERVSEVAVTQGDNVGGTSEKPREITLVGPQKNPAESPSVVNVVLRLDDLILPVRVSLKRLIWSVSHVLSSPPHEPSEDGRIPGTFFHLDPLGSLKFDSKTLEHFWRQRVLHWATSDAIEQVKFLLVRARAACAFFDRGPTLELSVDEWNRLLAEERLADERLSESNIQRRLDHFAAKYPDLAMPPLLDEVRTILQMRNCLLHNEGLVTRSFCNDGNRLRVRFERMSAWVTDQTGSEREYREGEMLSHPQGVAMKVTKAERSWSTSETIEIDAQTFVDVCLTVDRFAVQMAKALEGYGRQRGIPFISAQPTTTASHDPGLLGSQEPASVPPTLK